MTKIDQYLDRLIDKKLLALNEIERANHTSSGKLSASMLGEPLQWQILKMRGVHTQPFDGYTLRKFLRGKQIESWVMQHMDAITTQKYVEYRGCCGLIDAVVLSDDWDFKYGLIPHEVKSVANAKYKRILKEGQADPQHKLQAGFYAMATNASHYAIDYIASDDLRVTTYIYDVSDIENEIDMIIDNFNNALGEETIPVFIPRYKWQENIKYCRYPEWMNLTPIELKAKYEAMK